MSEFEPILFAVSVLGTLVVMVTFVMRGRAPGRWRIEAREGSRVVHTAVIEVTPSTP